jgi:GNAT superfamily N-acetyltransferase
VQIRDAVPEDAEGLHEVLAGGDRLDADLNPDGAAAVASIAADPDQRLLVAALDGRLAGAVHLIRGPLSPMHADTAIHVLHLHVLDEFRRHGIGHALMEATVSWAEEKDTTHVLAAASVGSRDANRFMARLGLGQVAVVRAAPVATLRAKLPVEPPPGARVSSRNHRSVGQVLAQRRSLRRARTRTG